MKLTLQKRLASEMLGISPKRVVFDPAKLADIKEAITKTDIRLLIGDGTIKILPAGGVSRGRANKLHSQKKKGLRRGAGSRKGKLTSRTPRKRSWITRIRMQREFLKLLFEKSIVSHDVYKDLYKKAGGGLFRSKKHIQIFIDERSLVLKKKPAQAETQPAAKK